MKRYIVCLALVGIGNCLYGSGTKEAILTEEDKIFYALLGIQPNQALDNQQAAGTNDTLNELLGGLKISDFTLSEEVLKNITDDAIGKLPEFIQPATVYLGAKVAGLTSWGAHKGVNGVDLVTEVARKQCTLLDSVIPGEGATQDLKEITDLVNPVKGLLTTTDNVLKNVKTGREEKSFNSLILDAYKGRNRKDVIEQIARDPKLLTQIDKDKRGMLHHAALGYVNEGKLEQWNMIIALLVKGAVSTPVLIESLNQVLYDAQKKIDTQKERRQFYVLHVVDLADKAATTKWSLFPDYPTDPTTIPFPEKAAKGWFSEWGW